MTDLRRSLPAVNTVLADPAVQALLATTPRPVVVSAVREVLEELRARGGPLPERWEDHIGERLRLRTAETLQPVLNATGVVLHTNLGRAPLPPQALEAMERVARGYATLEFDLADGSRGSRAVHCRTLLAELTGAESALVVNNAAGALVLCLNELADGKEVVISRGELIEIGGSFRIPDIILKSGARLREVGTTNRTHLADYRDAVGPDTGAILAVHQSNFAQTGFVASPPPAELLALAREHGLPFCYDVGSGLLVDLSPWGLREEPQVADAIRLGADLVVFSGDKLLGGPQAGCIVGRGDLVNRCQRNPFARALRADKVTLAALAATLALYRDPSAVGRHIPVLTMLTLSPEELAHRAQALAHLCPPGLGPTVFPGESAVGGGAFAGARLPTSLVGLAPVGMSADRLAKRLREGSPVVVARVADDRVVLDPRTLPPESFEDVAAALARAIGAGA